jgi:hypothetical protein
MGGCGCLCRIPVRIEAAGGEVISGHKSGFSRLPWCARVRPFGFEQAVGPATSVKSAPRGLVGGADAGGFGATMSSHYRAKAPAPSTLSEVML